MNFKLASFPTSCGNIIWKVRTCATTNQNICYLDANINSLVWKSLWLHKSLSSPSFQTAPEEETEMIWYKLLQTGIMKKPQDSLPAA